MNSSSVEPPFNMHIDIDKGIDIDIDIDLLLESAAPSIGGRKGLVLTRLCTES